MNNNLNEFKLLCASQFNQKHKSNQFHENNDLNKLLVNEISNHKHYTLSLPISGEKNENGLIPNLQQSCPVTFDSNQNLSLKTDQVNNDSPCLPFGLPYSMSSNAEETGSLRSSSHTIQEEAFNDRQTQVENCHRKIAFVVEINGRDFCDASDLAGQIRQIRIQIGRALQIKGQETLTVTRVSPCCLETLNTHSCQDEVQFNKPFCALKEKQRQKVTVVSIRIL
jgi:hypothetical protein